MKFEIIKKCLTCCFFLFLSNAFSEKTNQSKINKSDSSSCKFYYRPMITETDFYNVINEKTDFVEKNKNTPLVYFPEYGLGAVFLDIFAQLYDYSSIIKITKIEIQPGGLLKCYFNELRIFKGKKYKISNWIHVRDSESIKDDMNQQNFSTRLLGLKFKDKQPNMISELTLIDHKELSQFSFEKSYYVETTRKKLSEYYPQDNVYLKMFQYLEDEKYNHLELYFSPGFIVNGLKLIKKHGFDLISKSLKENPQKRLFYHLKVKLNELEEKNKLDKYINDYKKSVKELEDKLNQTHRDEK